MSAFPRYAIYYAPEPDSDLWQFGTALLGYDAYTTSSATFPKDALQAAPDWHELTVDPRKYGFHATLKAPFSLADGNTEAELSAACAAFAAKPRPIPIIRPVVDAISGFLAVVPAGRSPPLQQLATDCVSDFDAFRAPLSAADRERRVPARLTARQCEHLDRWGYPYVMDEFRFHLTVTGRLDQARRGPVLDMLRKKFAELRLDGLPIDRIALFRQNTGDGRFGVIGSWQLQSQ